MVDREALEDITIDGISITKGDLVGCFIYGLHRPSDSVENGHSFDENRFLNGTIPERCFIPFGLGPRKCIAQHFTIL